MSGALQGIRVLDFSAMISGPYCGRLLADLGAEVIKLEPPEGDYMRTRPPLRDGVSLYFGVLNAGKRSVALDLKHPDGVALAKDLATKADVVIENFRPGVMARLGLDYAALAAFNPRLVFCSISGYGQGGASASLPAYAPIVQAASGYDLANLSHQDERERPLNTGMFLADYLTGVHAFGAVCAALVRRDRTGRGEAIDCAMMDAMLGMLAYEVAEAQERQPNPRPLYKPTRARDGFIMLAPVSEANFSAMARAAGHPEWVGDPRFAGAARLKNWEAMLAEMDRWAADKTVAECQAAMDAGGVPCSRFGTVAQLMASPYAVERGLFAEVAAGGTRFLATNPPFRMEGAATGARLPALGEDGRR
ncbi:MAG: CoA transferase, partial [Betaproteobacteria bacterium]|nr:CoA transferase [Betaproteobacteria bacterium]